MAKTKIVKTRKPHHCCICKGWLLKGAYAVTNSTVILLNGEWVRNREWAHPLPCWKDATGEDLSHQPELRELSGIFIVT